MASIFDWSPTAGSNGTCDGVNIAEGCGAANLNNGLRAAMALIRQSFSSTLQSFLAGSAALPLASGGTGSTTAADARTALGLGSAATESTIPVAKGGTGATDAATARTNLGAAAATDGIGASQAWQTVSRSVGSTYQNTTGKPIMVSATFDSDSDSTFFQTSPDNSAWTSIASRLRYYSTVSAIIPAGHYYRATGPASVLVWAELR